MPWHTASGCSERAHQWSGFLRRAEGNLNLRGSTSTGLHGSGLEKTSGHIGRHTPVPTQARSDHNHRSAVSWALQRQNGSSGDTHNRATSSSIKR